MDRILQELSPRWLRLFVGHGARGAGGCRALGVRTSLDIVASPGTMLAPALSTDRKQQQQHVLMPASAKDAQHHAHHCCVCEAARHTHQASTHIRAHTRTHTHTRMRTYTNTNTRKYSQARTRTYTCTNTHTHRHTQTRACACTRCARDGLRQFFSVASDAPTLVQSSPPDLSIWSSNYQLLPSSSSHCCTCTSLVSHLRLWCTT